jgi:hypothetical protein
MENQVNTASRKDFAEIMISRKCFEHRRKLFLSGVSARLHMPPARRLDHAFDGAMRL